MDPGFYTTRWDVNHVDPHTTMRYDRARVSLDRHATYIDDRRARKAARSLRRVWWETGCLTSTSKPSACSGTGRTHAHDELGGETYTWDGPPLRAP